MNVGQTGSFVGKNLGDCYAELYGIGGMRSWAPYSFDDPSLEHIELRFNNHWGRLTGPGEIEYLVTVTDEAGLITFSEGYPLEDLEMGVVKLDVGAGHPDLGAIYFGCVTPMVQEWGSGESASNDYFYISYQSLDAYSVIHAQPLQIDSTSTRSGKLNCINILASEQPRILVGNPNIHLSEGAIRLGNVSGGKSRSFKIQLAPFHVAKQELSVPDGWYTVSCGVGRSYSHLMRASSGMVFVRHL